MTAKIYRTATLALMAVAGAAALSWQVLWQIDLSLALGVSAKGTALTLATVMVGMTIGALWSGRRSVSDPWKRYALLEAGIGLTAFLPRLAMSWIERADGLIYQASPGWAGAVNLGALVFTLGPATFLMGATLPVIGLLAKRENLSLSQLYAANTAGAGCGSLLVALQVLPTMGRLGASMTVAALDFVVAACAVAMARRAKVEDGATGPESITRKQVFAPAQGLILAGVTGVVTFMLEVSWFRMLRAAWLSTSDSFAVMLFCFLVALGVGAAVSKRLTSVRVAVPVLLCIAAAAIWFCTPLLERVDGWSSAGGSYGARMFGRVLLSFMIMGPAILLIGISLPAIMDGASGPREWARLYAVNTLGAVVGSIVTAWLLMEALGPVRASWLAAGLLGCVGIAFVPSWAARGQLGTLCLIAAVTAWFAETGIGKSRVQGPTMLVRREHQILEHRNGPDVTTSVMRTPQGHTMLFIDGYAASGEVQGSTSYMDAMGRLPMLLHPSPRDALVICFGTGQTVRAVVDEGASKVDVVDLNQAVFDFADTFVTNRGVLGDKAVKHHLMDGRAWLRRSALAYDVITLEPMPPFFAGSNALYSEEFYRLVHARLAEGGLAAQWFPMHLLTPPQARAVAAAFVRVFPNAMLWVDPRGRDGYGTPQQGILLGRKGSGEWSEWPGFDREPVAARPYTLDEVKGSAMLLGEGIARYCAGSAPVTDDNQFLSFGHEALHMQDLGRRNLPRENMAEVMAARDAK